MKISDRSGNNRLGATRRGQKQGDYQRRIGGTYQHGKSLSQKSVGSIIREASTRQQTSSNVGAADLCSGWFVKAPPFLFRCLSRFDGQKRRRQFRGGGSH